MKKFLLIIFLGLIFVGILVSCHLDETSDVSGNTALKETTPSPSYEKFVYRLEHDKMDFTAVGMPLKVNLNSGKTTTACIDPLCMHDTGDSGVRFP